MFYDRFESLCKSKGLTPTAVARKNGITQQAVSLWKQRGSTPNAHTIKVLAEYFGVSTDFILGKDTDTTKIVAAVCSIPREFHEKIFAELEKNGISREKIITESKNGIISSEHGSIYGEGFIVEGVTTEEAKRITELCVKVVNECIKK